MKIGSAFDTLTITGSERDRTSSGEVEADKSAGPAHALLSEKVGAAVAVAQQ